MYQCTKRFALEEFKIFQSNESIRATIYIYTYIFFHRESKRSVAKFEGRDIASYYLINTPCSPFGSRGSLAYSSNRGYPAVYDLRRGGFFFGKGKRENVVQRPVCRRIGAFLLGDSRVYINPAACLRCPKRATPMRCAVCQNHGCITICLPFDHPSLSLTPLVSPSVRYLEVSQPWITRLGCHFDLNV